MGEFARKVRFGDVPGPSQRKFDFATWVSKANDSTCDEADRSLALAGIYFHHLLSHLRTQIRLRDCDLQSPVIVRAMIAIANASMISLLAQTKGKRMPGSKDVFVNRMLQAKLAVGANLFNADELLTGVGDGLKLVLRDMLKRRALPDQRDESSLNDDDTSFLSVELNNAVLYQCAVELWHDCVGHGYRFEAHADGVALSSQDPSWEAARAVSFYRRTNLALQDTNAFNELWRYKLSRAQRHQISGMKFAVRTYGLNSITRIDVGDMDASNAATSISTGAKLLLMHGPYKPLMNEPMQAASGNTLSEIIDAWRFLQSLALCLADEEARRFDRSPPSTLLASALTIHTGVLTGALGKALGVGRQKATSLLKFLTFDGSDEQEVWSQPLAPIDEQNVCLVLPCIHSIHLLRVVERWMRQGGIELDRRGPHFESFCIESLKRDLADSALAGRATVLDRAVTFQGADRSEEIDLVLFVGDTVLLVEAKCVLWPDECLQYANYRDTVQSAVAQVKRKLEAVRAAYGSFSKRVAAMGYNAPTVEKVACCVLTNSAIYAGFPVDGVPVVDLAILSAYFDNSHVKIEARRLGQSSFRHEVKFYASLDDAASNLEGYLLEPPQLAESKASIVRREVTFPVESDEIGKLVHQIAQVEIDEAELLKRYGVAGEPWKATAGGTVAEP